MSGHSKWANIQHRKGAQDAKRGKLFTKLIREITVAARSGEADPGSNPRLRAAIDKALSSNMTKDTIERAIKRGSGNQEGENFEEIRYEGYGPGGVAIMVDCVTDNRNRAVAEIRHVFSKYGGNLGTDGSVSYLFNKIGIITYAPGNDEERIMDAALEAGADDVVTNEDGSIDVLIPPEDFGSVNKSMLAAGLAADQAEITMNPDTTIEVDVDTAHKILKLVEMLEDLDDVQNVYTNADFPAAVMANLTTGNG